MPENLPGQCRGSSFLISKVPQTKVFDAKARARGISTVAWNFQQPMGFKRRIPCLTYGLLALGQVQSLGQPRLFYKLH